MVPRLSYPNHSLERTPTLRVVAAQFKRLPLMKKRLSIQFGLLSVTNCIVTFLVFVTSRIFAYHWHESLPGEPLPHLTDFVLQYAGPIAVIFTILSLVGTFLSIRAQTAENILSTCFAGLTMVEILLLPCYAYALIYPSLFITYRLSSSG